MLENAFYKIVKTESTETEYRVKIALNAQHEIYAAHFPGNPITPGVCLLQICLELLNSKLNQHLRMVLAKNIKYLQIIDPVKCPSITFVYKIKHENGAIHADIVITDGQTVYTKINASYQPDETCQKQPL